MILNFELFGQGVGLILVSFIAGYFINIILSIFRKGSK